MFVIHTAVYRRPNYTGSQKTVEIVFIITLSNFNQLW